MIECDGCVLDFNAGSGVGPHTVTRVIVDVKGAAVLQKAVPIRVEIQTRIAIAEKLYRRPIEDRIAAFKHKDAIVTITMTRGRALKRRCGIARDSDALFGVPCCCHVYEDSRSRTSQAARRHCR